jgi:hypothetical protein
MKKNGYHALSKNGATPAPLARRSRAALPKRKNGAPGAPRRPSIRPFFAGRRRIFRTILVHRRATIHQFGAYTEKCAGEGGHGDGILTTESTEKNLEKRQPASEC